MGDGFGVPAFGEHADGDDAADVLAGLSAAPDGVEDVADGLDLLLFGCAGGGVQLGLLGGDAAEGGDGVVVGVAELGMDEQGGGTLDVVGAVAADVGEFFELAGVEAALVVAVAGDPAEEGGGVGDVVGDGDHDGDHAVFGVFGCDGELVVLVHAVEQAAHGLLDARAVQRFGLGLVVDVAVDGVVVAGVVVDGQAGDFGEAGFDGVGEWVVADGPGEVLGAEFGGAAQVHGCGGEVEDLGEARLGVQGLEGGEPECGAALFVFDFFGGFADAACFHAVAVVCFVVDHDDGIVGGVAGQQAAEHFGVGFFPAGIVGLAEEALDCGGCGVALSVDVELVASLEGLEVEDGDAQAIEFGAEVDGGELGEQVVGVIGAQLGEAIFDGEVGGDDQEVAGHVSVDGVPDHEHGHDDGLAGAGGHFEGEAGDGVVPAVVDAIQPAMDAAPLVQVGCLFGLRQPDRRLDSLTLAEEGAQVGLVGGPPFEQSAGAVVGAGIALGAPGFDVVAQLVDRVKRFTGAVVELGLHDGFAGAGGEDSPGRRPPPLAEGVCGLVGLGVEHPVVGGGIPRCVEDRICEGRRLAHADSCRFAARWRQDSRRPFRA